jgi:hypothetical protein
MPASITLRSSSFLLNQIIAIATISLLALACGPAQETVSTGELSVASPSPVAASVGERYEFLLEAAGGVPPVRWSIVEGALPEGLVLDAATGLIAGTPASAGTVSFSIAATDSAAKTLRTSLRISVLGGSRCRRSCGYFDAGSSTDAGTIDAGTIDAGTIDAGTIDAGTIDAGTIDAGTIDAGTIDAGTIDAGTIDAGTADAGATALSADPISLPVATTDQVPLTAAYDLLGVPAMAAGASYLDPTSAAKIYKLTSSTFPAASATTPRAATRSRCPTRPTARPARSCCAPRTSPTGSSTSRPAPASAIRACSPGSSRPSAISRSPSRTTPRRLGMPTSATARRSAASTSARSPKRPGTTGRRPARPGAAGCTRARTTGSSSGCAAAPATRW